MLTERAINPGDFGGEKDPAYLAAMEKRDIAMRGREKNPARYGRHNMPSLRRILVQGGIPGETDPVDSEALKELKKQAVDLERLAEEIKVEKAENAELKKGLEATANKPGQDASD